MSNTANTEYTVTFTELNPQMQIGEVALSMLYVKAFSMKADDDSDTVSCD